MAQVKLKEEQELWEPQEEDHSVVWEFKEEPECRAIQSLEDSSSVVHCQKEEPEEVEMKPEALPQFLHVSVKSEEGEPQSSVLHQTVTEENREDTDAAGAASHKLPESEQHSENSSDTDDSEDWAPSGGSPTHTLDLENTRRNAYDADFKLKAIDLANSEGNRAAARKLGINESMVRKWKRQQKELSQCKKTTKAFRGNKSRWPELENLLEDWVNTQTANGRRVSTSQIRLKAKTIAAEKKTEDFQGGPSWCLRFMKRKGLSIKAQAALCQQRPPNHREKLTNYHKFTPQHSIGPDDIINMDEVPLTLDLALARTVNGKGGSPTHDMENTRRNAYDADFKLKAIDLANSEGNRAAARKLGLNESMIRKWKLQQKELSQCRKTTKAFRGQKCRWPDLENLLEDWVKTQKADGRGISPVQIQLKAKRIAVEKKTEDFRGGISWCYRFMRRKGFFKPERTLYEELPPNYKEKLTNYHEFTRRKIKQHSIGPDDIINMDEVPLTLDLAFDRTVDHEGNPAVPTSGHERTHFTCVLGCAASGLKLLPMVIFKRMATPRGKVPKGIVVKVNGNGEMEESLMNEWLTECYGGRARRRLHRNKALLVLDSRRAHIAASVNAAIKRTNSIPAVIPGGARKYLQPLTISVTRAFTAALRAEWEAWMTRSKKSSTRAGLALRATSAQVCEWILTAWSGVERSTITSGFREAGLLRDEEDHTSSTRNIPQDQSDNERDGEAHDVLLRLFTSDTDEDDDDFCGFTDEDGEQ